MTSQRVTLITPGVGNLARSENFCGDMGWTPVSREEDIIFYQMNGHVWEVAMNPFSLPNPDGSFTMTP